MNSENLRRSLACAAVVAALGLPGGAANAVVYSSAFDPPDFDGTAMFDVAEACLATDGFHSNDPYTGCTVSWLSATVTLREDPYTRTFSYEPVFLPSLTAVTDIFVEGGELKGVNSVLIGPVVISGDPNPNFNRPWWIQYGFEPEISTDFAALLVSPSNGAFGFGIVNLFTGDCDGPCFPDDEPAEVAQVLNFTRITQVIPEPGTLGLILGALGGAWFARRRKRLAA